MKIGQKVLCTHGSGPLEWGETYKIEYIFVGGQGGDCLVRVKGIKGLWSPDRFTVTSRKRG